jgi:hypothetical protein
MVKVVDPPGRREDRVNLLLSRVEKTPPFVYPLSVLIVIALVYLLAANQFLPAAVYQLIREYAVLVFRA